MASDNLEILDAAYDNGAFTKSPNALQNIYFRSSIITAWEIIDIIQSRDAIGIEGESIALEMGRNWNTVNTFLRWLVDKKLIEFETPKGNQDQPTQARIYRIKNN